MFVEYSLIYNSPVGLKDHTLILGGGTEAEYSSPFLSDFFGEPVVNVYYSGHIPSCTSEFLGELVKHEDV